MRHTFLILTGQKGEKGVKLDERQSLRSAFETFSKKVELLLSWIKNPDKFFNDFIEEETDDLLWRYVAEEYGKELSSFY